MIERSKEIAALRTLLKRHRVVGLIGARQVGKTTLARRLALVWPERVEYFDMESPQDQARLADPMLGASWEGWVLEQVIRRLDADRQECFFWATHAGAELDLLVVRGRTRLGVEAKRTVAPSLSASMRSALTDLRLTRLDVVHAGDRTFALADRVRAVAVSRLLEDLRQL